MPHTALPSFSDGPAILSLLSRSLFAWPASFHSYGPSLRGHPGPLQRCVDWKRKNSLLRQGHERRKNRCSLGRGGRGHLPTVALIQESLWEVWKERKPADREGMMAAEGAARLQG